jgi:hypothetical protein
MTTWTTRPSTSPSAHAEDTSILELLGWTIKTGSTPLDVAVVAERAKAASVLARSGARQLW